MLEVDNDIELAVAEIIIEENSLQEYNMCNNHIKHDYDRWSNKYPYVSLDTRLLLSGVWEQDDEDIQQQIELITERFFDDFREFVADEFKRENDFEITFDLNGYRLLGLLPDIEKLREGKEALEEELEEAPEDEDVLDRLSEQNEEIIDYANKLKFFNEWATKYAKEVEKYYSEFVIKKGRIIHKDEEVEEEWQS